MRLLAPLLVVLALTLGPQGHAGVSGPSYVPYTVERSLAAANRYAANGQVMRAFESLGEALVLDPSCVPALRLRAGLFHSQGQLEESRLDLRRALAAAPEDAQIKRDLALVLFDIGSLDEAEELFRQLTDVVDSRPGGLLGIALIDCVGRRDAEVCGPSLAVLGDACVGGLATLPLERRWGALREDEMFLRQLQLAMDEQRSTCGPAGAAP